MKKLYYFLALIATLSFSAVAQGQLPPVWNDASGQGVQQDSRVRSYVSPTRIVWKSTGSGELVKDMPCYGDDGNFSIEIMQIFVKISESSLLFDKSY